MTDKQVLDTSAFIAVTDKSDQYHSRVAAYFRELLLFDDDHHNNMSLILY